VPLLPGAFLLLPANKRSYKMPGQGVSAKAGGAATTLGLLCAFFSWTFKKQFGFSCASVYSSEKLKEHLLF